MLRFSTEHPPRGTQEKIDSDRNWTGINHLPGMHAHLPLFSCPLKSHFWGGTPVSTQSLPLTCTQGLTLLDFRGSYGDTGDWTQGSIMQGKCLTQCIYSFDPLNFTFLVFNVSNSVPLFHLLSIFFLPTLFFNSVSSFFSWLFEFKMSTAWRRLLSLRLKDSFHFISSFM